ncbi:MAG: hypothetical protein M3352_03610 [Bacteroidota bacterium]|nr:hypothetical protein [Bacteroidota bacterium]
MKRNRPSDVGKDNDPDLRDDTALQLGASTVSSSVIDEVNDSLTETASDDFSEKEFGDDADKTFDETER